MNRVVVTGMGVISALGNQLSEFSNGLQSGRSAIGRLSTGSSNSADQKIVAEVRDFDPSKYFEQKQLKLLDRTSQFALVAAAEAIRNSGIVFSDGLSKRTAVIIGSGIGGAVTTDESYRRLYEGEGQRLHPLTIPKLMFNAPASHLTMEHRITGPSFVIASACSSANSAIGVALQMLRSGMIDAALTGGTEAALTYGGLKSWEALRVMAPDTCRPFSKDRKGMILGEGAAILVLETLHHAQARGAPILAEIIGYGMSSDASDIVAPAVSGAAAAMTACLDDAKLNAEDVDYINAHGTGTVANDATETQAIHQTFGNHARNLMVSSTKAMHGHALGAAGAIELVATIIGIEQGFAPPTVNFTEADPHCDLDYVSNDARDVPIDVALSNSFAFGGHNAVIAVRRASLIH
ncbi:MAG: beta-ketoacyl-[acyl-carrier-protein] synthase family protein [Parvibaculaceae bacterium]